MGKGEGGRDGGKGEGEKVCCGGGHGTPLVRGVAWL